MSAVGAILAGLAVGAACLSLRPASSVGRNLDLLAPRRDRGHALWRPVTDRDLRHAGTRMTPDQLLITKVLAACSAAVAVGTASLVIQVGPAILALAAYMGWAAPSLAVAARARRARSDADRATVILVERLDALVSAGRPAEAALERALARPTGAALLDHTLRRVHEAYQLGAPLFRTLALHAREDGLESCAALAEDLERARDLGSASAAILRERRSSLRALERARSLEAASRVEGKLMLVLALCYLPALMLLVVIPLFMALLDGLAT